MVTVYQASPFPATGLGAPQSPVLMHSTALPLPMPMPGGPPTTGLFPSQQAAGPGATVPAGAATTASGTSSKGVVKMPVSTSYVTMSPRLENRSSLHTCTPWQGTPTVTAKIAGGPHSSGAPHPHPSPTQKHRHVAPQRLSQFTSTPSVTVGTPTGGGAGGATPNQSPNQNTRTSLCETTCASVAPAAPSSTIVVAGRTFECLGKLGSGSFGIVWEVQHIDSSEDQSHEIRSGTTFALKCSSPARQEMLEACLLEAEVLKRLSSKLEASVAAADRIPRYVTHGVVAAAVPQSGNRGGIGVEVLLAMSKLDGQPLDQWLYGVDEHRLKTMEVSELLDGPLPGGQRDTRGLAGACSAAAALFEQMAPVFSALAPIAYHRDVSAHNFLVRSGPGGSDQFAVLDFGLAVRSRSWQQEWHERNIAGDPRYFSPAAWMLLAYGHKYLEAHPDPDFRRQYKYRVDHFALGVLAAEVVFALWRGPESDTILEDDVQRCALKKVRIAWRAYWTDVMDLFQKFHQDGTKLRNALGSQAIALSQLVGRLRVLCAALRAAATVAPHVGSAAIHVVFDIMADLIDWHGTITWEDLPKLLAEGHNAVSREPTPRMAATYSSTSSLQRRASETRRHPTMRRSVDGKGATARSATPTSKRSFFLSHQRAHTTDPEVSVFPEPSAENNPCPDAQTDGVPEAKDPPNIKNPSFAEEEDAMTVRKRLCFDDEEMTEQQLTVATSEEEAGTLVQKESAEQQQAVAKPGDKEEFCEQQHIVANSGEEVAAVTAVASAPPVQMLRPRIRQTTVPTVALEQTCSVVRPSEGERVIARPPSPSRGVKKYSHRRVWTVDEAVSLARGVPQVIVHNFGPTLATRM